MGLKERIKCKIESSRIKVVDLWGEKVGVRLLSIKEFKSVSFSDGELAASFLAKQFIDPSDSSQIFDPEDITTANFKELVDLFMDANTAGGKDAEKNSVSPRAG